MINLQSVFPVIRTKDATAYLSAEMAQRDVAKLHPNRMLATKPERPYGTKGYDRIKMEGSRMFITLKLK